MTALSDGCTCYDETTRRCPLHTPKPIMADEWQSTRPGPLDEFRKYMKTNDLRAQECVARGFHEVDLQSVAVPTWPPKYRCETCQSYVFVPKPPRELLKVKI